MNFKAYFVLLTSLVLVSSSLVKRTPACSPGLSTQCIERCECRLPGDCSGCSTDCTCNWDTNEVYNALDNYISNARACLAQGNEQAAQCIRSILTTPIKVEGNGGSCTADLENSILSCLSTNGGPFTCTTIFTTRDGVVLAYATYNANGASSSVSEFSTSHCTGR